MLDYAMVVFFSSLYTFSGGYTFNRAEETETKTEIVSQLFIYRLLTSRGPAWRYLKCAFCKYRTQTTGV